MPSEEQTQYNTWGDTGNSNYHGQRLTVPDRYITHVSFRLRKVTPANPVGNATYYYKIWKINDTELASSAGFDASTLSATAEWVEHPIVTPVRVNEEVRIFVHSQFSTLYVRPGVDYQGSDVKANESLTFYDGTNWSESAQDMAYKFTYGLAPRFTPVISIKRR